MIQRPWSPAALILFLVGVSVLGAQTAPTEAAPAPPARPAPPSATALDELMHKSGLWTQLPQFEDTVMDGFAEAMAKHGEAADEATDKVRKAVAAAYSGDRLRASVQRELGAAMSAAEVAGTLGWLDSELGRRITALEERAGEPEQQALQDAAAPKLLAETPPERVLQIRKLLAALRFGESMAAIVLHTSEGIARGLAVEDPAAGEAALDQLRATMEGKRAEIAQSIEEESVATFAFIYRNLTEPELASYLAFIESPVGQRYQLASLAAVDKALAEAAESLGRMLAATKST